MVRGMTTAATLAVCTLAVVLVLRGVVRALAVRWAWRMWI